MELRHLRSLLVLAEELHFGRAADRLGIAQPALSRQIQQLESELQTRLLKGSPRAVSLTDAGREFVETVRHSDSSKMQPPMQRILPELNGENFAWDLRVIFPPSLSRSC